MSIERKDFRNLILPTEINNQDEYHHNIPNLKTTDLIYLESEEDMKGKSSEERKISLTDFAFMKSATELRACSNNADACRLVLHTPRWIFALCFLVKEVTVSKT